MLRMLLIFLSSLLVIGAAGAGSAAGAVLPSGALRVAAAPPFQEAWLAAPTVAPGGEQALTVTLDGRSATTTILQLTVTYPDGATQEVLDQTLGNTATLTWQVPATAAAGAAAFRLQLGDCGCGDRSLGSMPANRASTLAGAFDVRE